MRTPLTALALLAPLALPSMSAGCASSAAAPPAAPAAVAQAPAPAPTPAHAPALAPAVTPAPNPHRLDRIAQLEQRVRDALAGGQDVPLVFLGDSITEGWESEGAGVWAREYAPRGALNLGIGGDQTQHVLYRLRAGHLDGLQPKVLVLMIGTNNTGNGLQPPEQIRDGIAAILAELAARMPETRVLLLAIFPRGARPDDPLRRNNEAVNALLAALCDGVRVTCLDLGAAFTEADGTLSAQVMPDALHLSPEGYERWARAMWPTLVGLMADW